MQVSYKVPSHLSTNAQSINPQVLIVDPTQRPTDQILGHPWWSQHQEYPPTPTEPLLKHLNPTIMRSVLTWVLTHTGPACLCLTQHFMKLWPHT